MCPMSLLIRRAMILCHAALNLPLLPCTAHDMSAGKVKRSSHLAAESLMNWLSVLSKFNYG
jgi:hypothetical protein